MAEMTFKEARQNVQRLRDGADKLTDESLWIVLTFADAWQEFVEEYGEDWDWEEDEDE